MKKIAKPGRLQLNKTTLRKLTEMDLGQVAGGRITGNCTYEAYCSGSCTCTATCYTYSSCPGGYA